MADKSIFALELETVVKIAVEAAVIAPGIARMRK